MIRERRYSKTPNRPVRRSASQDSPALRAEIEYLKARLKRLHLLRPRCPKCFDDGLADDGSPCTACQPARMAMSPEKP